jgi:acetylornithine/succinyldiaminopimelate/putrescine aminotransferase
MSLRDLLGEEYVEAVYCARAALTQDDPKTLRQLAAEKVDFFPKDHQQRLLSLLPSIGTTVCRGVKRSQTGAATTAFAAHTRVDMAPLTGLGYYRVGENGCLYLTAKSEHYHVSLGHGFPGYRLIELARRLGIPNATHNNTRGHITRLTEEELVRAAAGISRGDADGWARLLAVRRATAMNRVLNLETGSLAAEAAIKIVLSRFYKVRDDAGKPRDEGRIPVMAVIADDDGDLQANYHGTTIFAQVLRGMWPGLADRFECHGILLVRGVRPNDMAGLESLFAHYEQPPYKIAGFFHELVMMNYGARRLSRGFVRRMYALCKEHDVPTVVDEIQTGVWSPELFLFREYGVKPAMVVVGKGFPGGEYAASRILLSAPMDTLPQFGALVTNGQEELASLAYLITMRWVEANAEIIGEVGTYYEERLNGLADAFPRLIDAIEGRRHLAAVCFRHLAAAKRFATGLNNSGVDISVQAYKPTCPPSALTKLPLIVDFEVVDALAARMKDVLKGI